MDDNCGFPEAVLSMTSTPTDAIENPIPADLPAATEAAAPAPNASRKTAVQPVLEKLFTLYPHLFGAEFLPLKRGVYQELLAAHPDAFERQSLKAALGVHTRSTRYLQSVAAGNQRHDLQGQPVEPVAPEHGVQAAVELFRRRQARSREDLRPKLYKQLVATFEASGLARQDFLARLPAGDTDAHALLAEAFVGYDQKLARQEALCSAFQASGQPLEAFADMYGLAPHAVRELQRALLARSAEPAAPAAPSATAA